jgi:hypothetical protein
MRVLHKPSASCGHLQRDAAWYHTHTVSLDLLVMLYLALLRWLPLRFFFLASRVPVAGSPLAVGGHGWWGDDAL